MTLRIHILALLALVPAALFAWSDAAPRHAGASSGVLNAGFEDGVLGGLPVAWTATQPVPDQVVVTDTEDGSDFAAYADMGNIVVQPYRGQRMLRLGRPKETAENQNRGANTVSQTYISSADSLSFAFRIFSWEHRQRDQFSFNVTNGSTSVGTFASPLVVTMPDGATRTCSALPCAFDIDVGSSGSYLNTGWRTVDIVGLPVGVPLTVQYSVGGTNDESHATWAYFDNTEIVNDPPVASFAFPSPVYEGDLVQFEDHSYDADASDSIVAWHWVIDGEAIDSRNPTYIFPDEGTYQASLTITSSDGRQTTVASGEVAADGTPIPALVVQNADPLVNALNVEALAGQPAPLVARLADPGWEDSHTADWSVGGQSPAASLQEDNLPAYGTGVVTGTAAFSSNATGSVTVQDGDGGSASDNFNVTVVPDDAQRYEPNNTLASAPTLRADGSYLSYMQQSLDLDFFEVRQPDGSQFDPGSEVLLTLRDLPADLDLAVVMVSNSPAGDPGDSAQTSLNTTAFARSAFARSAFARSAFARSAFARSAFARSAFARSSFTFAHVPLSELGFTGLDGEAINGTDIGLGELGLSGIEAANLRIGGFSAKRGLEDETVLVRTSVAGTRVYAAVIGANGEFESAPYRLQVEASEPLDLTSLLESAECDGTPLVTSGATSLMTPLYDGGPGAQTLIVTQRERMRAAWNLDQAGWDAMLGDLVSLAQHPAVQGTIVSLPSTIFDNWDNNPCSIDAANALTAQIRSTLAPLVANAQYVVIVGDDGIVPFRRVPDETIVSNERDYVFDALLKRGSPLFASIALGYNLTDDYYVDEEPTAWQGRELYVPDTPIGRLVETPQEIRAAAQAFVSSNGVLNPSAGFVSAYDFFADGGDAMAGSFATKLPTTTLISDTWTADDLRCKALGLPLPGLSGCAAPALSAINAHFTHYGALSANGFTTLDLDDFLKSQDVADAGSNLAGALVFSMGCHAGFNAPDRDTEPADPGAGIDPALDFAQAMAIQRAVFVASTGFGLGDDTGLGGTEALLANFAQELVTGDVQAGAALVQAKRDYVNGLSAMTVYDEKSTIQTTLYGLPMYRVVTGGGGGGAAEAAGGAASLPASSLELTTTDGATTTTATLPYSEQATANGTIISAAGDHGSTAGRPIQPRHIIEPAAGVPVHSVLLLGGAYSDIANFDPVIASPSNEFVVNPTEPKVCLDSFWPSTLSTVNSLTGKGGALDQSVVITPAEFRCESGPGQPAVGLERLYSQLQFELLRCESDDYVPPVIHRVELMLQDDGLHATVNASDPSGIVRVIALRFSTGLIVPAILNVAAGDEGPYELIIPDVGADDRLVIQVLDGACNMTTATGKGAKLSAMIIDAGTDKAFVPGEPVSFAVKVFNTADLTAPLYYEWDFGDGTVESNTLSPSDLVPDGLGNAIFTTQHTYAAAGLSGAANVTVIDSGGNIALDSVAYACDTTNDTDADNLSICAEAAIGTDPADVDTDGDGCADGEEVLGASPVFGGQRDPLDFWDFFDVTGDQEIDLGDATEILSRFGTPAGSGGIYDRDILDSIHPWATSAGSNGIDLTDVLNNLVSFGHSCTAPP